MQVQSLLTLQDLPVEVLELILLDLPFFDLFRLQRVCRQWKALINTSVPLRRATFKSALPPLSRETFRAKLNGSNGRCIPPIFNPLLTTALSSSEPEATPFAESLAYISPPKTVSIVEDDSCPCPDSLSPFSSNDIHDDPPATNSSRRDHLHIYPHDLTSHDSHVYDNDPFLDGADSPSNTPPPSIPPSICSSSPSPTYEWRPYPDTIPCVLAAGSSLFTVNIPSPSSMRPKSAPSRGRITQVSLPVDVRPSWKNLCVFQDWNYEKVTITMQDLGMPGLLKCVTVERNAGTDEQGRGVKMGDLFKAVFPS